MHKSDTEVDAGENLSLLDEKPGWRNIWHLRYSGWRFGVLSCAFFAFFVFLFNFIFTVVVIATQGYGVDGRQILYDGSCERTRELDVGIHVVINVFSTVLLSASNYCMQCLSSPTRKEIERAHARGRWLDIGVLSIRNLKHISKSRLAVWSLLALTSLPIHLFYNSVVFSSIANNDAQILTVNQAFVDPRNGSPNFTDPYFGGEVEPGNLFPGPTPGKRLHRLASSHSLQNLSVVDCIDAYAQNFLTSRSGLLLVVDTDGTTQFSSEAAILQMDESTNAAADCNRPNEKYPWICQQDGLSCRDHHYRPCESRLEAIKTNSSGWRPLENYSVKYCLSERVEEHCRLQFSLYIGIIIVVLNLAKVILMGTVFFVLRSTPLMTTGDAVSSFLADPDTATEGMCLLSKQDVLDKGKGNWVHNPVFKSVRYRRFSAASRKRWTACILLYIAALGTCAGLLGHGLSYISSLSQEKPASLFSLGLGADNPLTFILWNIPTDGVSGLMSNVLVANMPQLILSFIYFSYNGLATIMYSAIEWNKYALEQKGLRVSMKPRGEQRSTYFLSLPYRIALPLMVTSGLLHWLVSQSIFLVVIETFGFETGQGNPTDVLTYDSGFDQMTCGWSPVGILAVIVVGFCLVVWIVGMGSRKFKTAMPLASTCSAALSAACHGAAKDEQDVQYKKVRWGVVDSEEQGVARCGITSRMVQKPIDGEIYY